MNAKRRELTSGERVVVFNLRNQGETLKSIAKKFGISIEGVRKIIKKLTDTKNAENEPGRGRKRKTSTVDERWIVIEAKKNNFISAKEIKESLNLNVCVQTIKNRLNDADLHGRIA